MTNPKLIIINTTGLMGEAEIYFQRLLMFILVILSWFA